MNILGISCFFHDAAAALLRDGDLVAAAEEERFTRKKHDYDFPINAIEFCLRQGQINSEDLDLVVFFEKPFLKFERILRSAMQTFPGSRGVFQESMITWLTDKLWIKALIRQKLKISEKKVVFSDHHLSHAASAFFCSPYDKAAILTVDGVGEWATATYGIGEGSAITLTREIRFPHSLGLLYSAFTAFLGFEVNEGEYKVMGMAPFGQPRYLDKVWKLIRQEADGSFRLDMTISASTGRHEPRTTSASSTCSGRPGIRRLSSSHRPAATPRISAASRLISKAKPAPISTMRTSRPASRW